MTQEQRKRIEDALGHLANNAYIEFCTLQIQERNAFGFGVIEDGVNKWKYLRDNEEPTSNYNLSLDSTREIGQKIGYEVWAVRTSGTTNDKFMWIGYSAEIDSFEKQPTDDYSTFYEAILEALITAIWDKFPNEDELIEEDRVFEWYCENCERVIEPVDVTNNETHDIRAGGCGSEVISRQKKEGE